MAGTVKVTFIGDSSNLKKHLQEIDKQVSGTESGFERFSTKMSNMGKSLTSFGSKMSIGVTAPLALLGKQAFQAASDMNESMSKVGVVFGDQASEIKKWSKTAATSMGLSQQSALEAAGSYGNLFQAFGVGKKESKNMSKSLVQVAADLASFNNTSTDDALLALKSGLSGEAEPLKRFGIAINDARLKEEALRLGLIKTKKDALDPGVKAQAAYALVMKDSSLAQGDYARTAGGAANKLKTLQAQFKDAAANIGEALLPVVTKLAGWLAKLAAWFNGLSKPMKNVMLILAGLLAAIGPIVTVFGALAQAIGFIASPIGIIVVAIAALVAAFVYLYNTNKGFHDWVDKAWSNIKKWIQDAWVSTIKPALEALGKWFKETGLPALKSFWQAVKDAWPSIQKIIVKAWEIIKVIFDVLVWTVKTILVPIFKVLWQNIQTSFMVITNVLQTAWAIIKPILDLWWSVFTNLIIPSIQLWWAILKPIFMALGELIKWVWDNLLSPVFNKLLGIWETIRGAINSAWDWINKHILDKVATLTNAIDGFLAKVGNAIDKVKELLGLSEPKPINYTKEQIQPMKYVDSKGNPVSIGPGKTNPAGSRQVVDDSYKWDSKKKQWVKKAMGGLVKAGTPYITGEGGGPELFVPSTDGTILNARQTRNMGGTTTVNVYPQDVMLDERRLADILRRQEILSVA